MITEKLIQQTAAKKQATFDATFTTYATFLATTDLDNPTDAAVAQLGQYMDAMGYTSAQVDRDCADIAKLKEHLATVASLAGVDDQWTAAIKANVDAIAELNTAMAAGQAKVEATASARQSKGNGSVALHKAESDRDAIQARAPVLFAAVTAAIAAQPSP